MSPHESHSDLPPGDLPPGDPPPGSGPTLSPAGHPETDQLADFSAEVLDTDEAAAIGAHVSGCAWCRRRLDSFEEVRAVLTDQPSAVMPADVAARIDAALRETPMPEAQVESAGPQPAAAPTVSRLRPWRGRSHTGLATLAAAASVALLISGVVAGALHLHNSSDNGRASTASGAANDSALSSSYTAQHSGTNYTATNLAAAVPGLIGVPGAGKADRAAAAPTSGAATGGTGSTAESAPAPQAAPAQAAADSAALRRLTQPPALFDCIAGLTERPRNAVVPLAVDFAQFQGKPAAVIILPSPQHPESVEAWVVGPGCGAVPGNDVLYWQRVLR